MPVFAKNLALNSTNFTEMGTKRQNHFQTSEDPFCRNLLLLKILE